MPRIEERSSEGSSSAEHQSTEIITISDEEEVILAGEIPAMNRTNVWDAFRIGSNPSPFSIGTSSTQLQAAVNLDWSTEAQSGNPTEGLGFEIELNLSQILDDEESNTGENVTASTPLATRGINTPQAPSRNPRTSRSNEQITSSVTRVLFDPAHEDPDQAAMYCQCCGNSYVQIVTDMTNQYLCYTQYPLETVAERNVRAQAYLDGIQAGLSAFQSGGLSQPYDYAGSSSSYRS